MNPTASSRLAAGLFLAAVTLAVFWPVAGNDFVAYDDRTYVTDNLHVQRGVDLEGLGWAWTAGRAGNWHPLTWMSHMLDWELYGADPTGHHVTSLALHILNTLLLFFMLDRLTGAVGRSAFVAALFALHPLHVESVAWVAERKDVLSAGFWMLTIWAYARYARAPAMRRYLPVMLLLALGLTAKPMLVTLPFVLLLLDYWPLGRGAERFRALLLEKIPLLVLAAASSVVTLLVQHGEGAMRSVEDYPVMERLSNAIVTYPAYLAKMVWPRDLAVFYPHPGPALPAWKVVVAALLLILITAGAVRVRRSRPYVLVGWLWYVGTLVPVIGLVQVGSQSMADRYTYLPLIGVFVIVAWGVPDLLPGLRAWLSAPAVALLLLLSAVTHAQLGVWRSSETLFEHALAVTRNNYVAHNNLGIVLSEEGRVKEALEHYDAALRIEPDYAPLHVNLGNALVKQARPEEAYAHYTRAIELDARSVDAHYHLGLLLARQGGFEEAIGHYNEALAIDPGDPLVHNNLGSALARQGKLEQAVDHFTEAIRHRPGYARAHANLAGAFFLLERYPEAWREVERARRNGFEPPEELLRALAKKMPEPSGS